MYIISSVCTAFSTVSVQFPSLPLPPQSQSKQQTSNKQTHTGPRIAGCRCFDWMSTGRVFVGWAWASDLCLFFKMGGNLFPSGPAQRKPIPSLRMNNNGVFYCGPRKRKRRDQSIISCRTAFPRLEEIYLLAVEDWSFNKYLSEKPSSGWKTASWFPQVTRRLPRGCCHNSFTVSSNEHISPPNLKAS